MLGVVWSVVKDLIDDGTFDKFQAEAKSQQQPGKEVTGRPDIEEALGDKYGPIFQARLLKKIGSIGGGFFSGIEYMLPKGVEESADEDLDPDIDKKVLEDSEMQENK